MRAVVLALRDVSSGEGTAEDLERAVDDLLSGGAIGNPLASPDTDLEVDVVVFRGHRVHGLSCYGGTEDDRITWKSAEIARRVVQLGGDYAQPGFVCLLDRPGAEDLEMQLRRSTPGVPSVTVFGLDDLLDWTSEQPKLGRLQQFLGLSAVADEQAAAELPANVDHDLLLTVGGTPLPILQSILTHRARRPLLLHTRGTAANAERIAVALARRSISSVRVEVPDGFRASSVTTVLSSLPPSAAVDITGGTKVLSTRVLLHHGLSGGLTTATYVDGRRGVLRGLAPGVPERALPTDVTLDELLLLRGWEPEPRTDAPELSRLTPAFPLLGSTNQTETLMNLASALISRRPADAEILCDVGLASSGTQRRDRIDLLLRRGSRVASVCVAWSANGGEVARAAWPPLLTVADVLGEYASLIIVTRLSTESQRRVERQLQRRSAGGTPVRVLGVEQFPAEPDRQADLLWSL